MSLRAATAKADIYWAAGGYPNERIDRAALDGSSATTSFIPSHALAMTTDGTYLYWTDFNDDIGRANLDGSNVNNSFVTNDGDAFGVAVGGGYIFWTGNGGIYRADLSDPSVSTEIVQNVPVGADVATYGGWIYWTASNCPTNPPCIARADLNGQNQNLIWREVTSAGRLAVNGQYIYWTGTDGHGTSPPYGIYRGNLSDPYIDQSVVTGFPQIINIALDATHLYWTIGYNGSSIGRANLDGSSPNANFIGNAYGAYGIAVDPNTSHTEPINTQPPKITGQPAQGVTLTETHGAWANDTPTGYTYQWLRCNATGGNCTSIASATGPSYVPGVQDGGATIRVQEVATNPWGTSTSATSAPTGVVQVSVPVTATPPTISGTALEGATLTEAHGLWSSSTPITGYAYQWMRCAAGGTSCTAIPGATQDTYDLSPADVGSAIAVTEAAANQYGASLAAQSAASAPVASAIPADVAAPTLVGVPVEGQTLSAVRGVWSNNPSSYAYAWLRCDLSGGSCQTTGVSGTAYGLSPADIGHTLRVRETAGNQWGLGATATSASIGPVADVPVSVQSFALVGTTHALVPGPVASFTADRAVPLADYSASVAWGDGSLSVGQVTHGPQGTFLVNTSHIYRHAGTYSMVVRIASKTGVTGQSTNRVSVINAAVCPKQSHGPGRNCLGEIAIPGGCVTSGDPLRVSLPSALRVAGVTYEVDHARHDTRGTGRRFAAALPTADLSHGTHKLTATITFHSGRPRTLRQSRSFAVC